ncbi:MAG: PilT domain-containing [Geobacteraceae bacterium]|nr:MAG: PilT domain-containing [Geobacteraceae bacterium]
MNVVDSSGWLEYFADGPNAGLFAVPLKNAKELLVPSITIFEVFKVVCRLRGEDQALQAAALMQQGKVVDLTAAIALQAAKTSLDLKLPMADSIILATARLHNGLLWTQDDDFQGIPGVKYFAKS